MASQNFEKALEELEKIVGQLEDGKLSLSESLELFEKGIKLARFLREELEKAEKKVEVFLKDEKGEVRKETFGLTEGEAKASSDEEEPDSGKDEDIPF